MGTCQANFATLVRTDYSVLLEHRHMMLRAPSRGALRAFSTHICVGVTHLVVEFTPMCGEESSGVSRDGA